MWDWLWQTSVPEILNLHKGAWFYVLVFLVIWGIGAAIFSKSKNKFFWGFIVASAAMIPLTGMVNISIGGLFTYSNLILLAIFAGVWILLNLFSARFRKSGIVISLLITAAYAIKPEIFNWVIDNWITCLACLLGLKLILWLVSFVKKPTRRSRASKMSLGMTLSSWSLILLLVFAAGSLIVDVFGEARPTIWVGFKYLILAIITWFAVMHHRVLSQPRDWAPKGSEESVHPLDKRRANSQEYLSRRARAIERLRQENSPYREYVHKPSVLSWRLMSLFAILTLLIDVSLFLSFLIWGSCLVFLTAKWLRNRIKSSEKGVKIPFGAKNKRILFVAPLVIVMVVWLLQNYVFALFSNVSPWLAIEKMKQPWFEILGLYLLISLEIGAYLIGSYVKVPLQRRWVLSIEDKPIYGQSVMIFTPDKSTVDQAMLGLYSEKVREVIRKALDRFGSDAHDYFDNGSNWSWLSFVLYPWVDIKSSYYLLVEATFETDELPTRVITEETQKRLGLHINSGTAGELSYYYRYYTLIGVDPVVGVTRLGTSDTEDPIQLVGTIIEGHIANRVRGLEFDAAMMYPFFEEVDNPISESQDGSGSADNLLALFDGDTVATASSEDEPNEISDLLARLNIEALVMAGFVIVKFNIIDRNPSQGIKDQINANTKARYALDAAEYDRGKAMIEARAAGAGLVLPLRMVAAQIQGEDPENEDYNPSPEALEKAREYIIAQQATNPNSNNRTLYSLPGSVANILGKMGGETS